MMTPKVEKAASIANVTGGYVIGSFNIAPADSARERNNIGSYRFIHQYSFNQSPEKHSFNLRGTEGYKITDLSFGHSYGYLGSNELWEFSEWMTEQKDIEYPLGEEAIKISINWKGRLPYPEGEDIRGRIPKPQKK